MKWIVVFVLAVLLSGCTVTGPGGSAPDQTQPTGTLSMPVPDVLSQWYVGLDGEYEAVAPMGEALLLFDRNGIRKLCGDDGSVIAAWDRAVPLPGSGGIRVTENGVVYYDAADHSLVTLDAMLRQISYVVLEDDMWGEPCLSPDGKRLYYCTPDGIRIWDAATGVSWDLMRQDGNWLGIFGLLGDGQWLRCRLARAGGVLESVLISTEDGRILAQGAMLEDLQAAGQFYCCTTEEEWIFGKVGQQPQRLNVEGAIALPEISAALTAESDAKGMRLALYDLTTGRLAASEYFPGLSQIRGWTVHGGNLVFLSGTGLYTWNYTASSELYPVEDDRVYTEYRYTASDPDEEGLAALQAQAQALGQRHGVQILLWEDALAYTPEGFTFTEEYRTQVFADGLAALEQALAQFPEGFLRKAAAWTEDGQLRILLVQTIDTPSQDAYDTVSRMHYLWEKNACIALTVDGALAQNFYHTLGHVIDSQVSSTSKAFDEWHVLNPSGFSYDNDYLENLHRDGSRYLEGEKRYFVNTFAMSFPTEDRAAILEYAMMPGNEAVFASRYMQAKLKRICDGLRMVFGLEEETYLWEQYLL